MQKPDNYHENTETNVKFTSSLVKTFVFQYLQLFYLNLCGFYDQSHI